MPPSIHLAHLHISCCLDWSQAVKFPCAHHEPTTPNLFSDSRAISAAARGRCGSSSRSANRPRRTRTGRSPKASARTRPAGRQEGLFAPYAYLRTRPLIDHTRGGGLRRIHGDYRPVTRMFVPQSILHARRTEQVAASGRHLRLLPGWLLHLQRHPNFQTPLRLQRQNLSSMKNVTPELKALLGRAATKKNIAILSFMIADQRREQTTPN
jgi:hypothetical protein